MNKRKIQPKKVEMKKEEKFEPKTEMTDDDSDLQRILELSMQTAEEDEARRKQSSQEEKKKRRNLAPKFERDSGFGKSPAKTKQAKKRKALDSSDEESEKPNESVKVIISSDDEAPTIRRRIPKPKEPDVFSDIEEETPASTIKQEEDEPDPFELFGSDFDTDNEFNPFEGDENESSKSEVSEVKSVMAPSSSSSKSDPSRPGPSQDQHPTVILSSDDDMETETRNTVKSEPSFKRDNVKSFPIFQPPVATSVQKTTESAESSSYLNNTVSESDMATNGFCAPKDACELLKERFGYR